MSTTNRKLKAWLAAGAVCVAAIAVAYGVVAILMRQTMRGLWKISSQVIPDPRPQRAAPGGSLILSGSDTVGQLQSIVRLPPALASVGKDSGIILIGRTTSPRWKQEAKNSVGVRVAYVAGPWTASQPLMVQLGSRDSIATRAVVGRLILDSGVVFRLYR